MRLVEPVSTAWEAASCAPGSHAEPAALDGLDWIAASVPGTAAAALLAGGRWRPGEALDLDGEDWWFRTRFDADPVGAGEEVALRLDGIATVAEVFLNGRRVLESDSMFAAHTLEVGASLGEAGNELAIRCRALGPLLGSRGKPRARWRTRLADGRLRFFRTTLLGRAPGFAPGPAAVGPWRPVSIERRRLVALDDVRLRTRLEDDRGVVSACVRLRQVGGEPPASAELELRGPSGSHRVPLELGDPEGRSWLASGELSVPSAARWWPHTHGEPALHSAVLRVECAGSELVADLGRVGFRRLAAGQEDGREIEFEGLDLHVNGVRVFARGAVWTPADPVGLAPDEEALRRALEQVRDAGMNMLRIPGTSAYESPLFHDLCDELGILVWQDFMFANFDYPVGDHDFRIAVEAEAAAALGRIGGRPSTIVLCGNSEVEQQAAMFGVDPALGRGELFGEILPRLVGEAEVDAFYVPSAPCGGERPFVPGQGIANYYGVGGYRRPLADARLAGVRFAAECLAFANVPDRAALEAVAPEVPAGAVVHDPRWKAGVPRDAGAGWDFDDIRDHYFGLLFDLDPAELRRYDHDRYLDLSRVVSGVVMAHVFGEWRRCRSPCGGGLVLWLRDLAPGAGWGLLDHSGAPKLAFELLRDALAPQAVWLVDEGLAGVGVHVANDRPEPLRAVLRVAAYKDFEQPVGVAEEELEVPPHGGLERDLEELLGHFADVSWAYRFGPPAQDLVVATLERAGGEAGRPISQAFHFPAGMPTDRDSADRLGIEALAGPAHGPVRSLTLRSRRFAHCVQVSADGATPSPGLVSLEPGRARTIELIADSAPEVDLAGVSVTALNLNGRVRPVPEG